MSTSTTLLRMARWIGDLFSDDHRTIRQPARQSSIRLHLETLEERLALSLTPIAPNAGYPFTAIVEIQATFPDHKTFVGSGVMIDRFHVLTAGHVLYSSQDGGFASTVAVSADENGTSKPFGTAYATYDRTYNTFINFNRVWLLCDGTKSESGEAVAT